MSLATASPSVLAGKLYPSDGATRSFVISAEHPDELDGVPEGDAYVQIYAPSGRSAASNIAFDQYTDASARYAMLSGILQDGSSPPQTAIDALRVGVWSPGAESAPPAYLKDQGIAGSGPRITLDLAKAAFLEIANGDESPSLFLRLPPPVRSHVDIKFESIRLWDEQDQKGLHIDQLAVPDAVAEDDAHYFDAFFGFISANLTDVAAIVARRIVAAAKRSVSEGASLSPMNQLALCHVVLRNGLTKDDVAKLRPHLTPVDHDLIPDVPALICLIDIRHSDRYGGIGERLGQALGLLNGRMPVLSETVRQLTAHLPFALKVLQIEDAVPPELKEGLDWLNMLARATIWEMPFLTYHGKSPLEPVARSVPETKKK